MKVLVWIKKEDVISGKITEQHAQCPQCGYQNYIQVEVTQDEYVRLEDKQRSLTYPEFKDKHYPDCDTPVPPCNDFAEDQNEAPFGD